MCQERASSVRQESLIRSSPTRSTKSENAVNEPQYNKCMTNKYTIEAHGVKGMKSTPWRKAFKSIEALNAWVEKNGAEIYAIREL